MQKIIGLMLAIMALVSPLAMAAVDDNGWSASTDNDTPYVGDQILVYIHSENLLPGYYYISIEVYNENGGLILDDRMILEKSGYGVYEWNTSLYMDPGNYTIDIYYRNEFAVSTNVSIIYDEVDFLSKRLVILEQEIERLDYKIFTIRKIADVAVVKADHYIRRAGFIEAIFTLFAIVLLLKAGTAYAIKELKSQDRDYMTWRQLLGFFPHGQLDIIPGHESMEGPGILCPICKQVYPPKEKHSHTIKKYRQLKAMQNEGEVIYHEADLVKEV